MDSEKAEMEYVIEKLADAVSEALDFFVARDEMNAKVHLAEPRWSPITDQCKAAIEIWRSYRYPIDHPEEYEEIREQFEGQADGS